MVDKQRPQLMHAFNRMRAAMQELETMSLALLEEKHKAAKVNDAIADKRGANAPRPRQRGANAPRPGQRGANAQHGVAFHNPRDNAFGVAIGVEKFA
eukprot:jgi/Tetstr1/440493/TSEL_028819.t1